MSRQNEKDRRKDVCIECKKYKSIKAKGMCQNCWHKYKRKYYPEFYLRTRYTEIKQRCSNPNNSTAKYYNGKIYCTKNEFLSKFLNDKTFNKLFIEWQKSGFQYKYAPSVDRIDVTLDYTIDNIQFLTHSQNCRKDRERKPFRCYDKYDNFIKIFTSQDDAAKELDLHQANIWKVLHKRRTHTKGYYFEFV